MSIRVRADVAENNFIGLKLTSFQAYIRSGFRHITLFILLYKIRL